MTVDSKQARRVVTNDGNVTSIELTLQAENPTDVRVYAAVIGEPNLFAMTLGSHYSVVLSAAGTTVNLNAPTAWDAYDEFVAVIDYRLGQPNPVDAGGTFGTRFENALDRMARLLMTLADSVDRSLKLPLTTVAGVDATLRGEPNQLLGWDETGEYIENKPDISESTARAEAAAAAAEAAVISLNIKRVVDNPTLKALDSTVTKLAFLPDDTGFDFKAINSATAAGFDTNEHIVVKDPLVPLVTGAWYRRLKGDRPGARDAFKAKGDGVADDTTALYDAVNWMEFYPLRSRVLTFEPGLFYNSQIVIPNNITGIQFVGNHWNSNIVCTDTSSAPAVLNKSQEFKMDGMTIMSTADTSVTWAARKNAINNLKDYAPGVVADVDSIFNECRFAGFYRGVYHKGRSVVIRDSHFSGCDYALELDWPSTGEYTPGVNQLTDDLGFRGNIFENNRIHSPRGGAVLNARANAHKLRGFKMSGITTDIGRRLFYGHLGRGARLSDMISDMTPLEVLALTGGEDFEITGLTAKGSGKAGVYTPKNLIQFLPGAAAETGYPDVDGRISDPYHRTTNPTGTTGRFRDGRISNSLLAYCEEHAIRDTSSEMEDVKIENVKFRDVGFGAPASYRCMSIGSTNSDIQVINPDFMGSDTLDGVVGNNFSSNRVKVVNPKRSIGNATPWVAGSPIILIGKRRSHTPVIVTGTGTGPDPYVVTGVNISTTPNLPTVSALDWMYLDDDWVEIFGRLTATVVDVALDGQIDINLPVPSTFTQPYQGSGSFNSSTTLQNIAGSVSAVGTKLHIRWKAPTTNNNSFSFTARYRVL